MNHLINLADLPVFDTEGLICEVMTLDAKDYVQLVDAINNPPKATEALVRAIKRADEIIKGE